MIKRLLRVTLVGLLVSWGIVGRTWAQAAPGGAGNDISFYIVAHQDDWQLFMGSDAYDDVQKSGRRVVFIFITAGQGPSVGSTYWRGREAGALAAMQAVVDQSDAPQVAPTESSVVIDNHRIAAYQYKKATSYFLRLPDGNVDGKGFPGIGGHSLRKLRDGTDTLEALDHSATYRSWPELAGTLRKLLQQEAGNAQTIALHCPETDPRHNPGDHFDHVYTGRLARAASAGLTYRMVQYTGYEIGRRPANLTTLQKAHQSMLYSVNCQTMIAHGLRDYWDEQHLRFIGRQYGRVNHRNAGPPAGPSPTLTLPSPTVIVDTLVASTPTELQPAYPNPFSESSLLRYSLHTATDVTVRVFNLQGQLVRTLVQARQKAGKYEVWLDVDQFPAAGQYICRLQAGQEHRQCRLELVR